MTRREQQLVAATVVLAVGGAAVASYLSYAHATDTSLMCPTSGCDIVRRSSYAKIAGVPVAYLGVAGYVSIVLTVWWRRVNGLLVCAAVAFSLYLLLAQLFAIHAICTWCVTSDAIAAGLLVLAVTRQRARARRSSSAPQTITGNVQSIATSTGASVRVPKTP